MLRQKDLRYLNNVLHIQRPDESYIGDCAVCDRRRWGGIETTWHLLNELYQPIKAVDICFDCVSIYGFVSTFPSYNIKLKKKNNIYHPCACGSGNDDVFFAPSVSTPRRERFDLNPVLRDTSISSSSTARDGTPLTEQLLQMAEIDYNGARGVSQSEQWNF